MPPTPLSRAPSRSARGLLCACLPAVLALAGCDRATPPAAVSAPAAEANAPRSENAPPLTNSQRKFLLIEAVESGASATTLILPGRVAFRPQAQSATGAQVAGRVVAVLIQPGQTVAAGSPLLVIDSADAAAARATLDQAVSRLSTAEALLRRQVEMVEKGVGLEFERQEAEARVREARSEEARARHATELIGAGQGNRVTLRAAVPGIVLTVKASIGAAVLPGGEALVELGDPSQLEVVVQAGESELGRIAKGQEAEVELPGLAARLPARVESVSPRVDPESRRASVYLALSGKPAGLRAGLLAQVGVRIPGAAALSLPVSAVLVKDGKRRIVYVARDDGHFEAREVEIGRIGDGRVSIMKGLVAGEKVVTRGALLLDTQAEQLL